jgi:hypothetical protein
MNEEEPTASYWWTGWFWGITGLKFKTIEKFPTIWKEFREYNIGKPIDIKI